MSTSQLIFAESSFSSHFQLQDSSSSASSNPPFTCPTRLILFYLANVDFNCIPAFCVSLQSVIFSSIFLFTFIDALLQFHKNIMCWHSFEDARRLLYIFLLIPKINNVQVLLFFQAARMIYFPYPAVFSFHRSHNTFTAAKLSRTHFQSRCILTDHFDLLDLTSWINTCRASGCTLVLAQFLMPSKYLSLVVVLG